MLRDRGRELSRLWRLFLIAGPSFVFGRPIHIAAIVHAFLEVIPLVFGGAFAAARRRISRLTLLCDVRGDRVCAYRFQHDSRKQDDSCTHLNLLVDEHGLTAGIPVISEARAILSPLAALGAAVRSVWCSRPLALKRRPVGTGMPRLQANIGSSAPSDRGMRMLADIALGVRGGR